MTSLDKVIQVSSIKSLNEEEQRNGCFTWRSDGGSWPEFTAVCKQTKFRCNHDKHYILSM